MTNQQAEKSPVSVSRTSQYIFMAFVIGFTAYVWWVRSDPNPLPTRPQPVLATGAVIDAPITLVSADKRDLACMLEAEVDGYHCEYAASDKTWSQAHPGSDANDRKHLLAPYRTIDDLMFLIPGLFEEPAVDERYRDEPGTKAPRDKLQRFTAQCKLKLIREVDNVMERWNPKWQWQGPNKVWMGTVSDCQVSDP